MACCERVQNFVCPGEHATPTGAAEDSFLTRPVLRSLRHDIVEQLLGEFR